jgi:hypothetical protein
MKKIYIAMAEMSNGNRIFERAYTTHSAAEAAVVDMIKEIKENTDWEVVPVVEEIELVDN